jgi:general secretion pathway protein E
VLPRKNVTFGSMLRSVVRQDPDIIMIGEIRDEETASIAVQSSLTGHLVFSTLHTNDSAGAIARLLDLGVEPFLISSSLLAVLAQRLVRKVCPACGRPDTVSAADLAMLNLGAEQGRLGSLRRGAGCDQCLRTGYRGRLGIFELLLVDDAIRPLINRRASASEIREAGTRNGLTLLRADGAAKALAGFTTVEEVLRVTQRDDETLSPAVETARPPAASEPNRDSESG